MSSGLKRALPFVLLLIGLASAAAQERPAHPFLTDAIINEYIAACRMAPAGPKRVETAMLKVLQAHNLDILTSEQLQAINELTAHVTNERQGTYDIMDLMKAQLLQDAADDSSLSAEEKAMFNAVVMKMDGSAQVVESGLEPFHPDDVDLVRARYPELMAAQGLEQQ